MRLELLLLQSLVVSLGVVVMCVIGLVLSCVIGLVLSGSYWACAFWVFSVKWAVFCASA